MDRPVEHTWPDILLVYIALSGYALLENKITTSNQTTMFLFIWSYIQPIDLYWKK